MGAELSWETHHPLLSDCWRALDLWTLWAVPPQWDHGRAGETVGTQPGTGGEGRFGEKAWCRHPSLPPLLHSFPQERLLANTGRRQTTLDPALCVLLGRRGYFHRKNIFIDKTLTVRTVRRCFAGCLVWFTSPWQEHCLPSDFV